jgi:hypothetical protein
MLCACRTSISLRVMTVTEAGVDMIGASVLVAPEARLATKPLVPALARCAVDTSAGFACCCCCCAPARSACRFGRWFGSCRDTVLRRTCVGRCARGAGASTLTGGSADAPDCPALCASAGEPVISEAPSANMLAVYLKVTSCETEIVRRATPCAFQCICQCPIRRTRWAKLMLDLTRRSQPLASYEATRCASSCRVFESLEVCVRTFFEGF